MTSDMRVNVLRDCIKMTSDMRVNVLRDCVKMTSDMRVSLVTRTRFTRYTFITSGGGYSKTVGYKHTLNWFRYIYLVPSPHLSNIYKIVFLNH